MNFHRTQSRPVYITTHNPMRDWAWGFTACAVIVGLYALVSAADAPDDQAHEAHVQFVSGIEEGLRQARDSHGRAVLAAYRTGAADARRTCRAPITTAMAGGAK